MKKVRFESPIKSFQFSVMDESECHSPRPFIERHIQKTPELYDIVINETQTMSSQPQDYGRSRILSYNNDPLQRYECSNTSPYPRINKTSMSTYNQQGSHWSPSNELELSMIDATGYQNRQQFFKPILKVPENKTRALNLKRDTDLSHAVLSSLENIQSNPHNDSTKVNDFFIRRGNLQKLNLNVKPSYSHFNKLSVNKENDIILPKIDTQLCSNSVPTEHMNKQYLDMQPSSFQSAQNCTCHHCIKVDSKSSFMPLHSSSKQIACGSHNISPGPCSFQPNICLYCKPEQCPCKPDNCSILNCMKSPNPQNAMDKKEWAVKMYQRHLAESMDIERQTNLSKEKREPTVSDLFKIIKLQNKQLQLLQEKVDTFISGTQNIQTVKNAMEQIAVNENGHKISIGVMTSFEMVRTSTIINKEVIKQTNEASQLQCNQSHVSVKEVFTTPNTNTANFLDGIVPVEKARQHELVENNLSILESHKNNENVIEEKTFNDLSLCNVHIDNSITPMMSPEPSLYLDVRDYSESETSNVDQSNVGWTYYNKVMTHVNGMLDDTDMPSTASALYRNERQQQIQQMQIDKTNVSVIKRVKFGDGVHAWHQSNGHAPSTDTSWKMNQLAAKYLKGNQTTQTLPKPKPLPPAVDMSVATRNYMEKHKILQGKAIPSRSLTPNDLPKFLDITALKQQAKLL